MSQSRTRSTIRLFVDDRTGASAVEFAILAPALLFLVFGIIGFGAAYGASHSLQTAASEGARAAVAGLSPAERISLATAAVRTNVAANVLLNPLSLSISAGPNASDPNLFTVTLQYDLSTGVVGAIPHIFPLPNSLTRTASIRRGGL